MRVNPPERPPGRIKDPPGKAQSKHHHHVLHGGPRLGRRRPPCMNVFRPPGTLPGVVVFAMRVSPIPDGLRFGAGWKDPPDSLPALSRSVLDSRGTHQPHYRAAGGRSNQPTIKEDKSHAIDNKHQHGCRYGESEPVPQQCVSTEESRASVYGFSNQQVFGRRRRSRRVDETEGIRKSPSWRAEQHSERDIFSGGSGRRS